MADQKITGALFQSMVTEGALAIAEKQEQVNELNVFPVPDGDTGTNMSMTMAAAMTEMEKLAEPTLAKAADTTAAALLRGARGNSGVILSLLFRGMAKKLHEEPEAGGCTLALALREGVETAYKAVMKPAEGHHPDRVARICAARGRGVPGGPQPVRRAGARSCARARPH